MIRTKWYARNQKPVRIGRYEWKTLIAGNCAVIKVFWDGDNWRRCGTGEEGNPQTMHKLLQQDIIWRGQDHE